MPSSLSSWSHVPPHTPTASSSLPSQSQSPRGMGLQPQSYTAPGPCTHPALVDDPEAGVLVVADAVVVLVQVNHESRAQGSSRTEVAPKRVFTRKRICGQGMVIARHRVLTPFHFVGVAHAVQIVVVGQHHPAAVGRARAGLAWGERVHAQIRVAVRGEGIEVARERRQTPHHFIHIAHPVAIGVGFAVATAFTHRIQLVAVAIAVTFQNGRAAAFVHRTRTVAHPAGVQGPHAWVHVVAHSVAVFVRHARTATFTQGVQDVAVAIALAIQNARPVADAAFVVFPHAWIHVVAHTIPVLVESCASAHAAFVRVQAAAIVHHGICVVRACRNVRAPFGVHARPVVVKHTALGIRSKFSAVSSVQAPHSPFPLQMGNTARVSCSGSPWV